ncbi:MAG: type II toxin-antitoxin system VapC family toxin [Chloroflexota bacterium]
MNQSLALQSPVFVDASAWIAAANRRDGHHPEARAALEECFARRIQLVTTNWTGYEALSFVKSRAGFELAADLWALFTDPAAVHLVRLTDDIEEAALALFFRFRDKTWGVVDCASLVVMERLGCRHVLAYDRHIVEASRQYGFHVIP